MQIPGTKHQEPSTMVTMVKRKKPTSAFLIRSLESLPWVLFGGPFLWCWVSFKFWGMIYPSGNQQEAHLKRVALPPQGTDKKKN